MKFNLYMIVLGLLLSFGISSAQKNDTDRTTFLDAEYYLISGDYNDALIAYLQLHKNDPANGNINYCIGYCLLNINGRNTEAIEYLNNAANKVSEKYAGSNFSETNAPPQTLFLLGKAYQINNQLDKAESAFNEYIKYINVRDVYEIAFVEMQIQSCETAKKYMSEPSVLEIRILNDIIPQTSPNFNPVLSADGNMFIYVYSEKFYNAVWMVRKQDNVWTNPVNISDQIMTEGDCYPTSITGDGKTLYLIKQTNYGSDIYLSHFDGIMWTPIEKLAKPINSNNLESHAGISADGNTLYFASNRRNSIGGLDIYCSRKNDTGKWDKPKNLGNTINTVYNEDTPFILPDGITLYFSSQGHQGMGGYDTYKSINQSKNDWSVPHNLGYPWNSTDDNVFFYPIENGEKALYAGIINKDETTTSIKEISLKREEITLKSKIELKGLISFQDSALLNNSLKLKIQTHDGSGINDSLVFLNTQTGEFSTIVEQGNYTLTANADNYESDITTIEISEDYNKSDFTVNIELMREEEIISEYIVIKNVFFEYNSYVLYQLAQLELDRLVTIMMQYPELQIEVIGHSDSKGDVDYNFLLSAKRANAVIEYLVSNGIEPTRFRSRGVGELESVAINLNPDGSDNPEGRKRNRNVTIKILKSDNKNIVVEPIQVPDNLKQRSQTIYTILLMKSDTAIDNSYFSEINSVFTKGVDETYRNSSYMYLMGNFYSISQAKEVLQSQLLSKFADAEIVNAETMEE